MKIIMDDKEKIKYYAARYVYKRKPERVPNYLTNENGQRFRPTWKEWWNFKFKDDYDAYVRRQTHRTKRANKERD